jgi:hypothetical protein
MEYLGMDLMAWVVTLAAMSVLILGMILATLIILCALTKNCWGNKVKTKCCNCDNKSKGE